MVSIFVWKCTGFRKSFSLVFQIFSCHHFRVKGWALLTMAWKKEDFRSLAKSPFIFRLFYSQIHTQCSKSFGHLSGNNLSPFYYKNKTTCHSTEKESFRDHLSILIESFYCCILISPLFPWIDTCSGLTYFWANGSRDLSKEPEESQFLDLRVIKLDVYKMYMRIAFWVASFSF